MPLLRFLGYLWAVPGTLAGLPLVFITWLSGGTVGIVQGCIEAHGGWVASVLRRGLPFVGPTAAMTLGHVIIGRDQACLDRSRGHEHVHVRQYERWGPMLLPCYLFASGWLYLRGLDPYLDNPFEREAFEATDRGADGLSR